MDHWMMHLAIVIGNPTRATLLTALIDGNAYTAGELARVAGISTEATTNQLAMMVEKQFVKTNDAGRTCYYRIASKEVADAMESLGITPIPKENQPEPSKKDLALQNARTCYKHIAGAISTQLYNALLERGYLQTIQGQMIITQIGKTFFEELGIDLKALAKDKRPLIKTCMDSTERSVHLAGSLGEALFAALLKKRFLSRSKNYPRALSVTKKGQAWLGTLTEKTVNA
jgi:predicted transcriptional regulator